VALNWENGLGGGGGRVCGEGGRRVCVWHCVEGVGGGVGAGRKARKQKQPLNNVQLSSGIGGWHSRLLVLGAKRTKSFFAGMCVRALVGVNHVENVQTASQRWQVYVIIRPGV